MVGFYLVHFGPAALALVVAVVLWLVRRRPAREPQAAVLRVCTILAASLPLLVAAVHLGLTFPATVLHLSMPVQTVLFTVQFTWPIGIGLVAVILLLPPLSVRRGRRAAEVSRRTMWTFVPRGLLVCSATVLVGAVALAVAAGVGAESTVADLYDWYYSVPALILLGMLLAVVLAVLALIARPPLALADDRMADVAVRRLRSRNVLLAALGAVALHLDTVLHDLALSSLIQADFAGDSAGWFQFETMTGALQIAGGVMAVVGLTAWLSVLLSVIPVPRRTRTTAVQQ